MPKPTVTGAARPIVALLLFAVLSSGCLVTASTYEEKAREADSLRDGLARVNQERNSLENRNEALSKKLKETGEENASLGQRLNARDEDVRKVSAEMEQARKTYEGNRVEKEKLYAELLDKEKAQGKKIQDFLTRTQECEANLDKTRKDVATRDSEIKDLRAKLEITPDMEKIKNERDLLSGRVERLTEEKRETEGKRAQRFTTLSEDLPKGTPPVSVSILGAAILRARMDDKGLFDPKEPALSEAGKKAVSEIGKAALDMPYASFLVSAATQKAVEEIRELLVAASKLPANGINIIVRERDRGAEILLIIP